MTMYHQLMNEEAYKTKKVPSEKSLYEEGVNFLFAGADTTGNALMLGSYYLLKSLEIYQKFKRELQELWPVLEQEPDLQDLEVLPYLSAIIKESLRMTTGVVTGLLRIVPSGGAKICETYVPVGVGFTLLEPGFSCVANLLFALAFREISHSYSAALDLISQSDEPMLMTVPNADAGWQTIVSCSSVFVHYDPKIFPEVTIIAIWTLLFRPRSC